MYGMKAKVKDPYVDSAEEAMKGLNEVAITGKFWVDMFPIMKYIPSWFPGAEWKKQAHYWRGINRDVRFKPFNLVKYQMVSATRQYTACSRLTKLSQDEGNAAPSICRTLIEDLPDPASPDRTAKEEIAMDTCAISYIGECQECQNV
jgi:hypothetical protein